MKIMKRGEKREAGDKLIWNSGTQERRGGIGNWRLETRNLSQKENRDES